MPVNDHERKIGHILAGDNRSWSHRGDEQGAPPAWPGRGQHPAAAFDLDLKLVALEEDPVFVPAH